MEGSSEYSEQAIGWMTKELWCDSRSKRFFLLQIVPPDPGAHPSAYSIDTDALHQECNSQHGT